jgi:NAD-dependent deacetylase
MTMDRSKILKAVEHLHKAESLVVLTGAGVSKESGVPTFRDAMDGLWSSYDPQKLATPAAFKANPKLVWDWYEYRRQMLQSVQPNPGHYAIAELEDLLPEVVVVTQNIDGLHTGAGSTDVIELHGNITQHKCFDNCQGNPTLIDIAALTWDRTAGPPTCPLCGSAFVRPNVVWFTESLPTQSLNRAIALCQDADVMLIVGTSGAVQPAASLPYHAKRWNDAYLIDVNPLADEITPIADLHLDGPSGEVLPMLIRAMREPA